MDLSAHEIPRRKLKPPRGPSSSAQGLDINAGLGLGPLGDYYFGWLLVFSFFWGGGRLSARVGLGQSRRFDLDKNV